MSAKDMTNYETDKLKVLRRMPNNKYGDAMWECLCACGNIFVTTGAAIRSGHARSCGCLQREAAGRLKRSHGGSQTRLFRIWTAMRYRCENESVASYKDYGGKGIKVCDEWQDFAVFRAWALSHGYTDALTIDRIDNSKGYAPENCRWATRTEQNRNTTRTHRISYNGTTLTAAEAARIVGLSRSTVAKWVREGAVHTLEDVVEKERCISNGRHISVHKIIQEVKQ